MYKFNYGKFYFEWEFEESKLKNHQIVVEKDKPVVIRGVLLPFEELENLIKKKARWIRDKIEGMSTIGSGDIVSGSRLKYLGKSYMVIVELSDSEKDCSVTFNARKFFISVNSSSLNRQELIQTGLDKFYRKVALDKIDKRIKYWEKRTGLSGCGRRIINLGAVWGRCSNNGLIEINQKCIELPAKIIDYIIVHELCHTVELNHTKEFWSLVGKHYPNWQECHKHLDGKI